MACGHHAHFRTVLEFRASGGPRQHSKYPLQGYTNPHGVQLRISNCEGGWSDSMVVESRSKLREGELHTLAYHGSFDRHNGKKAGRTSAPASLLRDQEIKRAVGNRESIPARGDQTRTPAP